MRDIYHAYDTGVPSEVHMGTAGQSGASPLWKTLYHAALLETNSENSRKLVTDRERAILDRIAAIGASV